ncbi:Predicted metal-dependent hydrolase, TIM-barrel fold [Kushneria avicenniae]|uniref:Predicted metal-dependent hydrolase, TIM-barrel fold n=1 Tax=Kushneria avicenniae TaxID=402385 RepID=A0A1I1J8L2_9GAMM|nr:amidohydrolase family protein [Kushneria avicenniae]SFC42948.1 Predicted metal-dependent hydrolase, TIM-barrel fold [Kushneria avicenniae]
MRVVDPHVHFWQLDLGIQPWLETPQPNLLGDYSPMARDFGPAELLAGAGDIDIEAVVHIEADATDPLRETQWLTGLANEAGAPDLIGALVVGADLSAPNAHEMISRQMAACDRVRGVRQILNVHADPLYDYVGRHYMREPEWRAGFALLAEHGLSFDLQLYPGQMPAAAQLAADFPDVTFVINHAGMYVDRTTPAGWRAWRDGLTALAARPNVAIKLSGFGMLDHDWTPGSIRPLILQAIDTFGVERCLFASNYPVDGLYAGYADIWRAYAEVVGGVSAAERDALFADNARHVYRIDAANP